MLVQRQCKCFFSCVDAIDQPKGWNKFSWKRKLCHWNMLHSVNGHKSPSLFIKINQENHNATKPTTFAIVIALNLLWICFFLLCAGFLLLLLLLHNFNGLCVWSLIESQFRIKIEKNGLLTTSSSVPSLFRSMPSIDSIFRSEMPWNVHFELNKT